MSPETKMRPIRDTIPFDDALTFISESAVPLTRTTRVPLTEASGRVLATEIVAKCDVPPFDRAAMDGYAVVAEDTMVVNTPNAMSAYRLASDGPQLLWVNKQLKDRSESPVIYNGHVYHIGGHGQVVCIESTTGEIAWQGEIGDTEIASPIIVDDKIIAVLEYGNKLAMFTAAPQKYELLAKADLPLLAAASPAVVDGKLYLRTKHAVACYDLVQPQGE